MRLTAVRGLNHNADERQVRAVLPTLGPPAGGKEIVGDADWIWFCIMAVGYSLLLV